MHTTMTIPLFQASEQSDTNAIVITDAKHNLAKLTEVISVNI